MRSRFEYIERVKHTAPLRLDTFERSLSPIVPPAHPRQTGRIARFLLYVALVVWVPGAFGASDDPALKPVLARAAGHEISASSFEMRYGQYLLRTGQRDSFALRRFFLEYLINTKLVAAHASEIGSEKEPDYRFERRRVEKKLLIDAFVDEIVLDSVLVSEADLRDLFRRMNTRVKARHLPTGTLSEAQQLHDRLRNGESFSALAREVFQDSTLANNGGSLGYFTFDEMDLAFEDAAFGLAIGEISAPVRTAYGFSVIQVEDRIQHPLLTETEFAAKKEHLRRFVLERKRSRALADLSFRFATELGVEFNEITLQQLFNHITGIVLARNDERKGPTLSAGLASFFSGASRVEWTIDDFRHQAAFTSEQQRAAVQSLDHLAMFITGLIVREEMVRRAREMQLSGRDSHQESLAQAMELWLYRRAAEEHKDQFDEYVALLRDRFDVATDLYALRRMPSPTQIQERTPRREFLQ